MGAPGPQRTPRGAIVWRVAAAVLLIVIVLGAVAIGRAPRWLGLYYLGLGVVSAALYWWDKRQAIAGGWRVRETTLHLLDLLGGVIGGLMAQVAWRHKTAKAEFGAVTLIVILLQVSALAAVVLGFVDFSRLS